MDPVTDFMAIMKILQALSGPVPDQHDANQPIQTPTIQLRSLAETSKTILECYHPTGRFHSVDVVEKPWSRQDQYGADNSAVLLINWQGGFLKTPYKMYVAIVGRGNELTAPVLNDDALLPARKKCPLNGWVKLDMPSKSAAVREVSQASTKPTQTKFTSTLSGGSQEFMDLIDAAELVAQGGPSVPGDAEAIDSNLLAQLARKVLAAKRALKQNSNQ